MKASPGRPPRIAAVEAQGGQWPGVIWAARKRMEPGVRCPQSLLLLLLLLLMLWVSALQDEEVYTKVSRREGETLTVSCPYLVRPNRREGKVWCKVRRRKCDPNFSRAWTTGPRYLLQDDPLAGLITVAMNGLRLQDSGKYWCMRNSSHTLYPIKGIQLVVSHAPSKESRPETTESSHWNLVASITARSPTTVTATAIEPPGARSSTILSGSTIRSAPAALPTTAKITSPTIRSLTVARHRTIKTLAVTRHPTTGSPSEATPSTTRSSALARSSPTRSLTTVRSTPTAVAKSFSTGPPSVTWSFSISLPTGAKSSSTKSPTMARSASTRSPAMARGLSTRSSTMAVVLITGASTKARVLPATPPSKARCPSSLGMDDVISSFRDASLTVPVVLVGCLWFLMLAAVFYGFWKKSRMRTYHV
ncbi:trem-like transcript 2 protein [Ornithorhynchus anatinus]|uniref:Trem-like transcript 2 protein n=1 Tax=Ornithorhynchus anatinus TaxID=9258 RepID=A0A6I8NYV7_ORNAN|nr:trem-like transcript 2 protein [Ornithorhynchus anatinus]